MISRKPRYLTHNEEKKNRTPLKEKVQVNVLLIKQIQVYCIYIIITYKRLRSKVSLNLYKLNKAEIEPKKEENNKYNI